MASIVIPYKPRIAFEPYHADATRFKVGVCHRRAGKTVSRVNTLIRSAVSCKNDAPKFAYLAPYYVQAKDIAWGMLKHYATPLLRVGGKVNESELAITLPGNGAVIRLYGAENIDRMRGGYLDGLVIDEAQDIAPSALTSVVLPMLADRKGWLDMSGTPKGYGNLLGKTWHQAQTDPAWWHQMLKASETGIIDPGELQIMRQAMAENEYAQEFECSFEAAITGAYYAKAVALADTEGRITTVPYDRAAQVHTCWDLGVADATVIWFFQLVGREVRFVDCYKKTGEGLEHYARVLQEKGYLYGHHYVPHDIAVREFGTGRSRMETASMLGLKLTPSPNLPVKDGIDAVRLVLDRCVFDRVKCAEGLDALRQYREKIVKGVAMGPLHDWTSHYCDSMRYGVVAFDEQKITTRRAQRERVGLSGGSAWMG